MASCISSSGSKTTRVFPVLPLRTIIYQLPRWSLYSVANTRLSKERVFKRASFSLYTPMSSQVSHSKEVIRFRVARFIILSTAMKPLVRLYSYSRNRMVISL